MINLLSSERDNLIAARISGKISKEQVQNLHPSIDKIVASNKKIDFYFELHDFHGYELGGLWADLKIDSAHSSDYGKMAIVGEKKWEEWATKATNLFTDSEVKYFYLENKESAQTWIGL